MRYLLILLLAMASAHAEVYRCEQSGQVTYSDKACSAGAQPHDLPAIVTEQAMPAPTAAEMAKRFDERIAGEKAARAAADAEFLTRHRANDARRKAIRSAIINHEVIEGMTPGEVESAMGVADVQQPGFASYLRNGQRTTIYFGPAGASRVVTQPQTPRPSHGRRHRRKNP